MFRGKNAQTYFQEYCEQEKRGNIKFSCTRWFHDLKIILVLKIKESIIVFAFIKKHNYQEIRVLCPQKLYSSKYWNKLEFSRQVRRLNYAYMWLGVLLLTYRKIDLTWKWRQKTQNDAALVNFRMTFYALTQLKTHNWRRHFKL